MFSHLSRIFCGRPFTKYNIHMSAELGVWDKSRPALDLMYFHIDQALAYCLVFRFLRIIYFEICFRNTPIPSRKAGLELQIKMSMENGLYRRSVRLTPSIPLPSAGRTRGSSSVGCVENVNCGVCMYIQSSDYF